MAQQALRTLPDPRLLATARKYIGLREIKGPEHSATIIGWLDALKAPFRDDETPWCGTFIGAMVKEAGFEPIPNPWGARNWLKFATEINRPALGCIVVFWRGKKSGWSGHVGIVAGKDRRGNLMVLGANQDDAVNIKPFLPDTHPDTRVLGYRWAGSWPHEERFILPILDSDGRVSTNEA